MIDFDVSDIDFSDDELVENEVDSKKRSVIVSVHRDEDSRSDTFVAAVKNDDLLTSDTISMTKGAFVNVFGKDIYEESMRRKEAVGNRDDIDYMSSDGTCFVAVNAKGNDVLCAKVRICDGSDAGCNDIAVPSDMKISDVDAIDISILSVFSFNLHYAFAAMGIEAV